MKSECRPTHNDNVDISKKRRRVTFSSGGEVVISSKTPTIEDLDNAWYKPKDLDVMRKDVKAQAKRYRNVLAKTVSSSSVSTNMSSLVLPFANSALDKKMVILSGIRSSSSTGKSKFDTTFRGLEQRMFPERQRNRIIAIKTTLEYQRRTQELLSIARVNKEPDIDAMKEGFTQHLGVICSQLSMWAKDGARAVAKYDAGGKYEVSSSIAHNGPWQRKKQSQVPLSTNKNVDISMPSLRVRPSNIPVISPPMSSSPSSSVTSKCNALKRKRLLQSQVITKRTYLPNTV